MCTPIYLDRVIGLLEQLIHGLPATAFELHLILIWQALKNTVKDLNIWKRTFPYSLFVICPLFAAVGIYIFFRSESPIFLRKIVEKLPNNSIETTLLGAQWDWFVYNLPDGLWAFGFASFVFLSPRSCKTLERTIYLSLAVFIMVFLEAAQGTFIAGTFDAVDLIAIVLGVFASIGLLSYLSQQQIVEDHKS